VSAVLRHRVFADLYKDSVSLMQLGATLRARAGIDEASCIMATPANVAQLADAGLAIDAGFKPSDLLVVVRGTAQACEAAIEHAVAALQSEAARGGGESASFVLPLTSLAMGLEQAPDADLALISVPGDYAAAEARKALALGLHVMLFSDNVTIDDERAIKSFARERGLLVMGPDCGTAIVNGVPLGFANVVRRGDIGLIAASGTGLQEVTCRIHQAGGGVSQALGTGGRDLKDDIGGITMLQGVQALAADPRTRVIVLISKPPSAAVAQRILDAAASCGKPVVVDFLGARPESVARAGIFAAGSLQHAADAAVAIASGRTPPAGDAVPPVDRVVGALAAMQPSQRDVRGLFCGGTFCYETQLVFLARGLACSSNAPAKGARAYAGHDTRGTGHLFVDLGEDEYTRGRPHPMIDPSLRNAAIRAHAADAATAVLLFDLVLGFGAHPDPAADLAQALRDASAAASAQGRTLALVGHVCGTDGDPQDRARQIRMLADAGVVVAASNHEAAALAAEIAVRRGGPRA
jgi:succinyl-CoA synthetase alpha subunit